MTQVVEVDAVLPLVDETNFDTEYQGGESYHLLKPPELLGFRSQW